MPRAVAGGAMTDGASAVRFFRKVTADPSGVEAGLRKVKQR